ncbi:response regulator transcription factor [Burkholderia sp. BCC1988]|uniref:response regulator transcription factor n=1 Tax=Burkholderia sp. BCC1988 TaxID=2817443 RepID=UPI002AB1178F|nr:response regulator transcription factor [Burkholderia sp. BCC1988]
MLPRFIEPMAVRGEIYMPVLSIMGRKEATCAILNRDPGPAGEIGDALRRYGFVCRMFDSSVALHAYLKSSNVDMVLVIEPNRGGLIAKFASALRNDRSIENVPLMVVGPENEDEMVAALTAGADAYLSAPASIDVVIARIRALLRRIAGSHARTSGSSHGAYAFHNGAGRVCVKGEHIVLTRMEYRAALLMFTQMNRVVTFTELWKAMWEGVSRLEAQHRTVCVHMSRVRTKLRLTGDCGYQLISVRGAGYKLVNTRH